MRKSIMIVLALIAAVFTQPVMAQDAKPTIVLVHGAFAGSSSWDDVISKLESDAVIDQLGLRAVARVHSKERIHLLRPDDFIDARAPFQAPGSAQQFPLVQKRFAALQASVGSRKFSSTLDHKSV